MIRFIAAAVAAILSLPAWADVYSAPQQIALDGADYKLVWQQKNPQGRAIYEYTRDGEAVDNWTALVTMSYTPQLGIEPLAWTNANRIALERQRTKPHYDIYLKDGHGYLRQIFEPDAGHPDYEANLQKSFHLPACGTLVLQYALRFPKSAELSAIKVETDKMAAYLEQDSWQPVCSQSAAP